ncbi:phosphoribosyl-AMP cyclohydrolase [Herbiconiux liangxiaofengii]|uniref:phosphoribosyl-AMP cyclohydrolase n=1 Tax=Herbiconiux liangxiaofengii TaxID=3342795 RepID=UPI0035B75A64
MSTVTDTDEILSRVRFDDAGLLPAVIQQYDSKDVLMLGYMDAEALRRTLTEGRVTFWSRSRQEYWRKGDTSGHVQWVKGAALDCDDDTLLVQVDQVGAACHTGARRCFDVDPLDPTVLDQSGLTQPVSGEPEILERP